MSKLQDQAQTDLQSILKLAALSDSTTLKVNYLKTLAKPFAAALAGIGATGIASYYFTKKDKDRHDKELAESFKSLATKSPKFQKDPTNFIHRFGELSVISPTIAKNPTLASKLLEKKLSSGFSVDDIHKLTSIEHNTSTSRKHAPGAAARASAYHALTTITNAFGRDFLDYQKRHGDDYKKKKDTIDEAHGRIERYDFDLEGLDDKDEGGSVKQSSAQKVSDECLGTMLAERYVLIKQAGLFGEGMKNMGKGMAYFAPALALGGGIELIRQAVESRRNAALETAADKNFKDIMSSNVDFKTPENKELAEEAFSTLKAVAPSLAARPLVAKTFINFTVAQGQLAPATVQQLAEAEDKVRGVGGRGGFFEDLQKGLGMKGGRDLMSPKTIRDIEGFGGRKPIGRGKK